MAAWPWLAEQKMKESGVCYITIGEVFCCLVSRICCSAVHFHLFDCLMLYGQVGVGVKNGFTCLLLLPTATDATDLHSLLKLDMDNACNECIKSVFLNLPPRTIWMDPMMLCMSFLQSSNLIRDVNVQ